MDKVSFWISLGPLIVINGYFLVSMIWFTFIYKSLAKVDFVENRHHSKILNKWIRHWWIWVTTPLFRFFLKLKCTPNQISALGTLLGVFSGLSFAFAPQWVSVGSFGLGGWFMIFGGSLDFMDGRVARETGQESLSGAFFDSVMDRIAECVLYSGLAWYFRESWILWIVMAAFTGGMMTSYSKCRGDKMGVSYEGGTMQRPERIVYTAVGAIFAPVVGMVLLKFWPEHFVDIKTASDLVYVLPLSFVAILSNYTTYDRIRNIMRLLDVKEGREK